MTDGYEMADRDVQVLRLIVEEGAPLVTDLREALYWAEKNQHVHYRVGKLEERELVERKRDSDVPSRGPLDPVRVRATPAGEEYLETMGDERPDSLEGRVEKLEKQFDPLERTYMAAKRRIRELESDVEDLESENRRLREDLERLQEVLEDVRESPSLSAGFEFSED